MHKGVLWIAVVTALLLVSCGGGSVASGTGTGTGNPAIAVVGGVHTASGDPVEGAQVQVRNRASQETAPYSYLGPEFDSSGFVYTDSLGIYQFSLLDTGYYRLEIREDSGRGNLGVSQELDLQSFGDTTQADTLGLLSFDTIAGTITKGGAPLPNARVSIAGGNGVQATTDGGGYFNLPVLQGAFRLVVFSPELSGDSTILSQEYPEAVVFSTLEVNGYK